MTSRERVRRALNHKEPDRVPIDLGGFQSGISYETYIPLKQLLHIDSPTVIAEPIQGLAAVDEDVLDCFGVDTRYIFPRAPHGWDGTAAEDGYFVDEWGIRWRHSFRDEWGIKWHRPSTSHYYDMVDRALSRVTIDGLDAYPWPDPLAPGRTDGLKEAVTQQTTALDMEAARLKREFGRDLVFWGGIDTQHVLPFGTPVDVVREAQEKIRDLAAGGGYILAACHNIQAKTPPENGQATFQAAQEFGSQKNNAGPV